MGLTTAPTFSVLITGGTIVDGTGGPAYQADVGLQGDVITAIGDLGSASATTTVDASGLTVTPGFIDVHVHSELALLAGHDSLAGARQGITTNLLAPDGFGWAPLDSPACEELFAYTGGPSTAARSSRRAGRPSTPTWTRFAGATPLNVFPQVPHCAVRLRAMGWEARHATPDELQAMEDGTREWMDAGAGALCLGLDYQPSANASFEELVRLCRITAENGGIYAAHQRYAHLGRPGRVARDHRAGQGVRLSRARQPRARGRGVGRGPGAGGPRGSGPVVRVVPLSCRHDPPGDGAAHSPAPRRLAGHGRAVAAARRAAHSRWNGWPSIWDAPISSSATPAPAAMWASAWPPLRRRPASRSASSPSTSSWEEEGAATLVFPWQTPVEEHERVIAATVVHPRMMVASDGVYDVPHPHPRSFGCFARVLGDFVRDRGLLSPAGGDLQDGRIPGRALPRPRPRRDPSGRGRRSGGVRRRHGGGPLHLGGAEAGSRRHALGAGQRPPDHRRRQPHRRPSRAACWARK